MAEKIERFGLVLTPAEKQALEDLARRERITAAAVVRRLIWQAAYPNSGAPVDIAKGG